MKEKHKDILTQFTATFSKDTVRKWQLVVDKWEADPTAANPYEEPDSRNNVQFTTWTYMSLLCFLGKSLHDVRLELAKEEADNMAANGPLHRTSLTSFFTTAFDLEVRQYVFLLVLIIK